MKKYYVTWHEYDRIFGTYDTPFEAGFSVGEFLRENPEYDKSYFRFHKWGFSKIVLD